MAIWIGYRVIYIQRPMPNTCLVIDSCNMVPQGIFGGWQMTALNPDQPGINCSPMGVSSSLCQLLSMHQAVFFCLTSSTLFGNFGNLSSWLMVAILPGLHRFPELYGSILLGCGVNDIFQFLLVDIIPGTDVVKAAAAGGGGWFLWMMISLVQCAVPCPLSVSSLISLLSQHMTKGTFGCMLGGVYIKSSTSTSFRCLSAIDVSTSWIRLFDSEWPKWLSISTSCELLVRCLTVRGNTTCLGVFTLPPETQCSRSWAIDMTCRWFLSDSFNLSAEIVPSLSYLHSIHAKRLYTRSGMLTLFYIRSSAVGCHGILFQTAINSALIICAHLNTWFVFLCSSNPDTGAG